MIEMVPPALRRALEPFPAPVRTLDAIHLAAIEFIRAQGVSVQLASYDERMVGGVARLLGIPEWNLTTVIPSCGNIACLQQMSRGCTIEQASAGPRAFARLSNSLWKTFRPQVG
jgi:hypothetical protein